MVQLSSRVEQQSDARPLPATRILVAGILYAGVLAILIARCWTGTGFEPAPVGQPEPGLLTAIGLPVAQYVHEIAGVAVVGLLFLRCVALPGPSTPATSHLLEMAARWAWLWVGSTVAWVVFTLSELIGVPVTGLLERADVLLTVAGTDRVLAELATLWVALLIALFVDRVQGVGPRWAVLFVATAALLPSALSGHAGHHSSPTLAMSVLAVHLAASAVWVGGLLALIVHLRPFQQELRMALPRFSTAALLCVLAIGLSGVVESVITLDDWQALWVTERGHLILAKSVALVVLAAIGYAHRRRTLGPAGSGRMAPLLRLAAGELLIMSGTIGIAVVLSTTA
jgi:putative copper resistance protein D